MSNACTPILVGGASFVSEILVLSKTANFPSLTMDYSPWSSKNLMDQNWLKKFVQVGIDATSMHTNFAGRCLSSFGDTATFKNANFPFLTMDYSPWSSKKIIDWNCLKKFIQILIDVKMHTHILVGGAPFFQRYWYFQKRPIFPF